VPVIAGGSEGGTVGRPDKKAKGVPLKQNDD